MSVSFAPEHNGASPNSDPQFGELLRKVEMYLDRDFAEQSEQLLLQEIEKNPISLQLLQEENTFRHYFKASFKTSTPPVHLKSSILEKIRHISS